MIAEQAAVRNKQCARNLRDASLRLPLSTLNTNVRYVKYIQVNVIDS